VIRFTVHPLGCGGSGQVGIGSQLTGDRGKSLPSESYFAPEEFPDGLPVFQVKATVNGQVVKPALLKPVSPNPGDLRLRRDSRR